MMRWISLILIIQFISGCGINKIPEYAGLHFLCVEESVWKLTMEQWGTERFTGVLAVRTLGPDFHLVLLDATGIKLLETTMSDGSDARVVAAIKAVRDRGLPEYLSKSTLRIFDTMSDDVHCLKHGFIRICKKKPASDVERKEARFGPFLIWSVDYFYSKDVSEGFVGAVLQEPWRRSKLTLELFQSSSDL
ncbi:MAG: hypothetical protein LWX01_06385 [Deltaproteobacteria bacterium]|nr:hypothetical protein [Deltaproteobacteria bacterium]MDL1961315.1 hypothetical protein [Deltaproteobacteria bacterium]